MKRYLLTTLAFSISLASIAQKEAKAHQESNNSQGYNIPITLTPFKNTWVYLGCYFGKYKNLADSTFLNEKGQGVFKGEKKLPRGIYFAVSPSKFLLFEFIVEKDHFRRSRLLCIQIAW